MDSLFNPEPDTTEPKPANIELSAPPIDPLRQLQPKQAYVPPKAEKFTNVKQYSHSQLQKKKNKRSKRLFTLLTLLILIAAAVLGALFGPKAYRQVFANPDEHFEAMLPQLFTVDSETYSIESSAEFGLVSAQVSRDSSDFLAPKTSAKIKVDLVADGVVIDADIESYALNQMETIQNITELSVFKDSAPRPETSTQLVKQKWVTVPNSVDYEQEGLVISFFDLASGFNDVRRTLPIGGLSKAQAAEYSDKLLELSPYEYTCNFTDSNSVSECDVRVDVAALNKFYSYVAKENDFSYPVAAPNYLEEFTVFIDTETDLPLEIKVKEGESSYRMVMDLNGKAPEIVPPVGPIDIDTYRVFARQFEDSL